MANEKEHKHHRIAAIDGLRAVAVLSVIIYHLSPPALPGGYIGVDVFFLISGYVVCGSLLRDPSDRFLSFVSAFYTRRMLRIYPAVTVLLLVTGFLSALFIPESWLAGVSWRTGFYAFFGLSNAALIRYNDSYFSPTVEFNPYTHTWSLGVEEQFYVLFPLILLFYLRARARTGTVAALCRSLLPFLCVASLLFSIWETAHRRDWAYYLLPSRFWELGLGALLCLAHQKQRLIPTSSRQSAILTMAGLVCIGVSTFFAAQSHFPFPWAIAPVLGAAFCIAGVVSPFAGGFGNTILTWPLSTYIGRISYSVYLWHWPVIVLFRWTRGIESAASISLAAGLTFLLSIISYHLLESPIQRRSFFLQKQRRLVLFGGACLILLSSLTYRRIVLSHVFALSVTERERATWRPTGVTNGMMSLGAAGKPWSQKKLFVVGDSHAGAYAEMLQMLLQDKGVSVYLDSVGGAATGSLVFPNEATDREREVRLLSELERQGRPGDIVFLTCLRVLRLGNQWANYDLQQVLKQRDSPEAESNRVVAVREGKAFIGRLEQLGLRVLIDAPKPVFFTPPFRCSDWFNRMNPIGRKGFSMDRDFLLKHRAAAMRSIQEVQEAFPKVRVWDPFWNLCHGATCSAFEGPYPLFFDSDHLSAYGNRKLYPYFVSEVAKIWAVP